MTLRTKMQEDAFRLAAARAKKKQKMIPESKKTLMMKLQEIADDLNLGPGVKSKVNGVVLELYPISALAGALGRTSTTIRMWEANKIIPKATFRSKSNRRMYAALQIALVVYLADKYDIGQGKPLIGTEFVSEIHKLWPEIKKMILKGDEANV